MNDRRASRTDPPALRCERQQPANSAGRVRSHWQTARTAGAIADDIDIGAIVLAEAASDIPPATLPALNFLDGIAKGKLRGASYATAGYGSTGGLNHNDPALEVTDGQRRVGTPRFLNIQTNYVRFQENANAGNSGPCYLDSGGPTLLVDPATGSQTLIALTYGGSGLNPCKSIALQYRLDVQSSIDFIQGVIDGL